MELMNAVPEKSTTTLFSNSRVSPEVTRCIVIPVKDEEAYILKTLTALAQQVDISGAPLDPNTFEILLLANNCTDRSVASIKAFCRQNPDLQIFVEDLILPSHQANIGYVRRLLMDTAYQRLSLNSGGIILTTDADTRVAPDWIAQTQAEMEAGADAVGGRILFCATEAELLDGPTTHYHLQDETYQLLIAELEAITIKNQHNPAPTHHQHFNGSFAVTTACYEKSGGVPHVTHLEDCAFFEQLQRVDAKVRHSPKVVVHTSARYTGRSEVGLSSQLNLWKSLAKAGEELLVESGTSILQRLKIKKQLMDWWKHRMSSDFDLRRALENSPFEIKIDSAAVEAFHKSPFFGEWYAQIIRPQEIKWRTSHPDVSLEEAIKQLQTAIAIYSEPGASHTSIR
jgi:glycosyltransferase involved in cell wall biosynthesis